MPSIDYAVEVLTGTATTDANTGLKSGTFGWITGQPSGGMSWGGNEVQSGTISIYAPGAAASSDHNFYTDFILKNGLSKCGRRVSIERTGDYGTLSGFNFTIINDDFWKTLETNDVPLTKRVVIFYVVIGNVFYQVWKGEIVNNPYDETNYKFVCKGNLSKHKNLPPIVIDDTTFPNADSEVKGDIIPVCIGDVPRAILKKVSADGDYATLASFNGIEYQTAAALGISNNPGSIAIINGNHIIAANELDGRYLFVASGQNADKERGIRINFNGATVAGITNIFLKEAFDVQEVDFSNLYAYKTGEATTSANTWMFRVAGSSFEGVVSTLPIEEFKKNDDYAILEEYDKNTDSYRDVSRFIFDNYSQSSGNTGNFANGMPGMAIRTLNKTRANGFSYYERIQISRVSPFRMIRTRSSDRIGAGGVNLAVKTVNMKRNDNWSANVSNVFVSTSFSGYIDYQLPSNSLDILENAVSMFVGIDYSMINNSVSDRALIAVRVDVFDQYGRLIDLSQANQPGTAWAATGGGVAAENLLPDDYYFSIDDLNGETSDFSIGVSVRSTLQLDSTILDYIKDNSTNNRIRVTISVSNEAPASTVVDVDLTLKQIGIFVEKKIELNDLNLYTAVKGENTGSDETRSVYHALKHIAEDYDGIASADIDYGNLANVRGNALFFDNFWHVGRQIVNKKNSMKYIQQLCKHSMVCAFTNRLGKLAFSAWLDDTTVTATHDASKVVRGSITKYEKTPAQSVFNDFYIRYGINPGSGDFDKAFQITNADLPQFPTNTEDAIGANAASGQKDVLVTDGTLFGVEDIVTIADDSISERGVISSIATNTITMVANLKNSYTTAANGYVTGRWEEYASGLPGNAYAEAKTIWDQAKSGYDQVKSIQEFPKELAELPWYTDHSLFNTDKPWVTGTEATDEPWFTGTGATAWKFLKQVADWCTRQKNNVEYSLPITAGNIEIDLLDRVSFVDAVYTDSVTLSGWLSRVEINPSNDSITVKNTLEPTDWQDVLSAGNIVETGSASDTITESGAQPDTITETGFDP